MKAHRYGSALHGWEDEDYSKNQQKLKEFADKVSGRNRD
jgi:hypothetical protein